MIHIYNGILLSHKKEQNKAIWSNIDGSRSCHAKWSKLERERKILYDITYMWNLKYDTNEPINETERDPQIENRFVDAKGEGIGEGWVGSWRLVDVNYYIYNG